MLCFIASLKDFFYVLHCNEVLMMNNFLVHGCQFLFIGFSCLFSPHDRAQILLRNLACL
jgi:hypothetical protein